MVSDLFVVWKLSNRSAFLIVLNDLSVPCPQDSLVFVVSFGASYWVLARWPRSFRSCHRLAVIDNDLALVVSVFVVLELPAMLAIAVVQLWVRL